MKYCKKFLACALVLCMVMSFMSVSAFAARMEEEEVVMTAPAAEEVVGKTSSERPSEAAPAELFAIVDPAGSEEAVKATLNEALENGAKFAAVIASKNSNDAYTQVVGTVDGNYTAKLVIPGSAVSASNATIGVGMANVGSMGITTPRIHTMTLNTGIDMDDIPLSALLSAFNSLDGVQISASITNPDAKEHNVNYRFAVTGEDDEAKTITGTPADVAATRAAWAAMMENFTFDKQEQADSKIVIANGSYLQVNGEKLCFEENYADDLVLDNLNAMDPETIKAAVRVINVDDTSLEFVLKAGTTLAVSSSIATLENDVKVVVGGLNLGESKFLSGIRESVNNGEDVAKSLIGGLVFDVMVPVLGSLEESKNITVDVDFTSNEAYNIKTALKAQLNKGNKFVGIVASTLTTGGTTEVVGTVDSGYKATLTIPNGNVNPNSLYLGVGMKDVASLGGGERVHGLGEIKLLGEGNDMDLPLFQVWDAAFGGENGKSNLSNFTGAIVNATIKAPADGEISEKKVTYTLSSEVLTEDSAAKVITATPSAGVADAWHLMVNENNFTVAPNADNDSKIVIASGSWLQIGNKKLQFAEGKGDISLLSNTGADTVESILDKVELVDTEDNVLSFYLTKGTELAVSSSSAKLARDVKVTVTGVSASDFEMVEGENFLVTLQNAVHELGETDAKMLIIQLATLLDKSVGAVNNKTIGVEIEFICEHKWEKDFWDWDKDDSNNTTAVLNLKCTECGETDTKDAYVQTETKDPTCEEAGVITHTATVQLEDGRAFTDTKTEVGDDPLGHDWEVTFTRGANNTATYVATCQNDETHVEEGDATVTETTSGRTTTWTPSVTIDGETITGTSWSYTRPAPSRPTEDLEDNDPPLADKPWMFEDVEETDWFYDAVYYVYNNDIMDGVSDTLFDPYTDTTRGMVAQVLYRMEGKPSIEAYTDVEIPDLADDAYYHDAAIWAYATGAYKGYDDGNFYGDKVVTRQELVTVLYRFAKEKGYDATETNDLATFIDNGDVAPWAREAMEWAVGAGLMKGRTETTVTPLEDTMRIELATILYRFEQKYTPEEKPEEK